MRVMDVMWPIAIGLCAGVLAHVALHLVRRRSCGSGASLERELVASRERLRTIVEALGEGVLVIDGDHRISECNPAAERILGTTRDELIGAGAGDLRVRREDGSAYAAADHPFIKAVRSGGTRHGEIMGVPGSDGRWMSVNTEPIVDGTGRVTSVIVSFADITDLRQAVERAESANRFKSDFLANTSHEIRTPMTAILGFVDALEDMDDAHDRALALETIKRNARQLLEIINDILDVSKIEAGKLAVESVETSIAQIITDIVTLLGPRAADKGIGIRTHVQPMLPLVLSDPTRLRQILTNLLSNAIKFTPAGSVEIRAETVGEAIRVEVADSGIGMTDEQCARAFEAFSQADSSTTRRFGGTGLGLRICALLADLLDVDLDVVSSPGAGSTFSLMIPVRTPSRRAA